MISAADPAPPDPVEPPASGRRSPAVVRRAGRILTDPRAVGVAQAAPRTAAFMLDRWRRRSPLGSGTGAGWAGTVGLAAQVMLDEVVISAMRNPKLFPRGPDYLQAAEDVAAARRLWEERGWLSDPAGYHAPLTAPMDAHLYAERSGGLSYQRLCFQSPYRPDPAEPGRERWESHVPNRTVHAFVRMHSGPPRPWLVCIHGFGMGRAQSDLRAFRVGHLHRDLGLNVLLPVLPLHGPRLDPGADRGEGLMGINVVDTLHGLAQGAADVRACIRWIGRHQPGVPVGVYGISLGGYVSALTASLEDGLACAVAGIPAVDMPDLYRRHAPPAVRRRAQASGALGPDADAVMSVVSPLVLAPRVDPAHRYVFAGVGDRMASSDQARRLWEHWGRGPVAWYPGGHIGFFWTGSVSRFVEDACYQSGLTDVSPEPSPSPDPSPSPSE